MANNLTGDYEAVVQVSVRKINGILSMMHRNKVNAHASDAPPTFEHSSPRVRIEDLKIPKHDTTHFAKWYAGVVQELRETGVSPSDARSVLSEKAPPGVSSVLKKGWRDLDIIRLEPAADGAVRGTADVQLSNPTISLAERSVGEVIIHVTVRVHYDRDNGSAPMPEPIHGEVRATYIVKTKTEALSVQVSSHDNQIQFIPRTGSGLNAADADIISAQVRKILRHQFVAADVPMPAGSHFAQFIALGAELDPTPQALALPLQLSESAAGGNINSVNNHLLGGFDFAIAVSKEYVISKFQPTLDTLRQFQKDVTVEITTVGVVDPDYHISVSSADLFFENGAIKLEIHAKATTHHVIARNYNNIVIKQLIRLVLADESVTLQASDSDLTIDGITGPFANKARSKTRSEIIDQRNKALDPEPPGTSPGKVISETFNNARTQLNETLLKFDPFSSVSYKALEINPDGIVLRGAIAHTRLDWRLDPVVDPKVAGDGFTAFNSWIPGGRIEKYHWTYPIGGSGPVISFKPGVKNEIDRFIIPTPSDLGATGLICLRIEGTQMSPDGIEVGVTGGETCKPWWSEPILTAPYGSLDVLDPIWNPPVVDQEQPLDFIVDDAIAGHVSVMGQSPPSGGLTTNTLIHFAGRNLERPLETLSHALSQMRQPHMSLVLFLVLPMGTFATRRSEFQAQLGSLDERFTRNLHITEDYAGGWTKAFAAPEGPSTHLINARGELVWKREGKLNPDRVAKALDEHLLPALAPRSVLMRLAAQPGEQAPDAFFRDDQGGCVTLRRLRGQPVLLNFWKSWSKPCLKELRRLQTLQEQRRGSAPAIMAVNSEHHAALSDVRCENNLTLRLIPDRNQSIAELYGVQCWPTTVSINQEGIIDRIQFGLVHEAHQTGEYAQY